MTKRPQQRKLKCEHHINNDLHRAQAQPVPTSYTSQSQLNGRSETAAVPSSVYYSRSLNTAPPTKELSIPFNWKSHHNKFGTDVENYENYSISLLHNFSHSGLHPKNIVDRLKNVLDYSDNLGI